MPLLVRVTLTMALAVARTRPTATFGGPEIDGCAQLAAAPRQSRSRTTALPKEARRAREAGHIMESPCVV